MAAQTQGDLRGLKILVAGMGVLIVLGTALVIGVVIHRMMGPRAAVASAPGPVSVPGGMVLAAGEQIKSIVPAGAGLAVWVRGPNGERILFLDPTTGRAIQALVSVPPENGSVSPNDPWAGIVDPYGHKP